MAPRADQPVVLGFEVVEPAGRQRRDGQPRRLIRCRYTVRSAADEACDMFRRLGHPEAYVREVLGFDDVSG